MGSTLNVLLGKFARSGIEARLGSDVRIAVVAAVLHYTRRLKSGCLPVPPPRFCWTSPEPDTVLELQVDPARQAALERQAEKYHVSLNQILVHAVFVYLADLEASSNLAGWPDGPLH